MNTLKNGDNQLMRHSPLQSTQVNEWSNIARPIVQEANSCNTHRGLIEREATQNMMDVMSSAHSETDGESEGVWSPEIEQAFQEALKMFPPCGRRKHILQEEGGGKMYGRNELIARYIEQKTGQKRTRKQVSSHIQVLSRREARARTGSRTDDASSLSPASSINGPASIGAPGIRSDSVTSGSVFSFNGGSSTSINGSKIKPDTGATTLSDNNNNTTSHSLVTHQHLSQNNNQHHHTTLRGFSSHLHNHNHPHLTDHHHAQHPAHLGLNAASNGLAYSQHQHQYSNHHPHHHHHHQHHHLHHHHQSAAAAAVAAAAMLNPYEIWDDRPIMTRKIRLVEFSAFIEQQNMPANRANHPTALNQATQAAVIAAGLTNSTSGLTADDAPMAIDDGPILSLPTSTAVPAATFHQSATVHHHGQQPTATSFNNQDSLLTTAPSTNHLSMSAGFQRHSFVRIDYQQLVERQANKMEKIDIREIQDKFPDIGGPDGLVARSCASDAFFLVKFWADLDYDADFGMYEDQNSYFGFSSHFETLTPYKDITCSTKACSYGEQIVEKVEKIHCAFNNSNNTYSYVINRSPMCEFMIQFIKKLRQLPELPLMNRILENFTVLQIVTSESSSEVLLCIAYVFEIASLKQSNGSHYHVYKLTKPNENHHQVEQQLL